MSDPLISIIVPVYNVEQYLEKCIKSILSQSYQNFELILVDDGSVDKSSMLCDRYAAEDGRIIVIHKENGGLSSARNAGLDRANGDFIGFVDSDDYVADDFCETLLQAVISENADMAICNYLRVDETYNLISEENNYFPITDSCINTNRFLEGYFDQFGWCYVVAWNKLYRRALFDTVRYPEGKLHEDEFIIHRLAYQCERIVCIAKPLYYYVRRNGSIMSTVSIKNMDLGEALVDQYWYAKKYRHPALKNYASRRLSYKLEEWKNLANQGEMGKQKYDELRKKALFLLYEKSAWEGYSLASKIYYRLELLCPGAGNKLRGLIHLWKK